MTYHPKEWFIISAEGEGILVKTRKIIPIAIKKYITDPDTDVLYWRAQSYQERLAALEEIRQEYHRWKNDVQPGFQRVYRIIKR